ncbi:hypothetical protein ABIC33_004221 [Variovorax sp. 1140]|uniref:hypothetical protein n=1 Tax=Variovorax atrisoli TaxID=3394203 RepID=UPI003394B2DE
MIEALYQRHIVDDGDETRIPMSPGVYAFHLNLIGIGRCGLRRGDSVDHRNIERVKSALQARLSLFALLHRGSVLEGSLLDTMKIGPLKSIIDIKGLIRSPEITLSGLNIADLNDLILLLESTTYLMPPLYIGVACDQPLRTRYTQHRYDFESDHTKNVLGYRLRKAGVKWSDLAFSFNKLPPLSNNTQSLLAVESILHAINPPPLSLK